MFVCVTQMAWGSSLKTPSREGIIAEPKRGECFSPFVHSPRVETNFPLIVWKMGVWQLRCSWAFYRQPPYVLSYTVVTYFAMLNCSSEVAFKGLWHHTPPGRDTASKNNLTRFEMPLLSDSKSWDALSHHSCELNDFRMGVKSLSWSRQTLKTLKDIVCPRTIENKGLTGLKAQGY